MNLETNNTFSTEDIEKNKTMAALAYILFFIPLITSKDSPFAKYHANQSLVLLIGFIVIRVILFLVVMIVPALWYAIYIISLLIYLLYLAVSIFCLISTLNGKSIALPVVSTIKIIK